MKREEKDLIIESIVKQIGAYPHLYLTDTSCLNAEQTSALRRKCFENEIQLIVVKNTLLKKAMEKYNGKFDELYPVLKSNTAVMLSNNANSPAKMIKDFRKKGTKPSLKGAFVQESVYIGDNQIDALISVKSKEELVGDIIALLQSPAKTVISQLQSAGGKLGGILKTLSERPE